MAKPHKIILLVVGAIIALLVLVAAGLLFYVNTGGIKSRFEAAASAALGMETGIDGRLEVGFLPGMHVTLNDVNSRNQGEEVFSAKKARIGIGFLPLLRKEVLIRNIELEHARISIERGTDGKFNFEKSDSDQAASSVDIADIYLSSSTFIYKDNLSGQVLEAGGCDLILRDLRLFREQGGEYLENLSVGGELACDQIMINGLAVSDFKAVAVGKDGIFDFEPVAMQFFGARGSGSIRADFSGDASLYQVRFSLPQFRIEEFIKTLSPQQAVEGTMDFSANLSLQGRSIDEMKQTARGEVSLQGGDLVLMGRDLDQDFARYESSQSFNLVDAGAFFFAGPAGLALTRGYKFASLFQGSGGSTAIRRIVSDWQVEQGIARAGDVAMATAENRIALQGRLDFVNERFDEVVVALIDANGCTIAQQTMHGPFLEPVVEKPSILETLTGPAVELFEMGKDILTGAECEVFYDGSVAAPE